MEVVEDFEPEVDDDCLTCSSVQAVNKSSRKLPGRWEFVVVPSSPRLLAASGQIPVEAYV